MELYEIFWTGGFDSSYRVAYLSRFPIMIQPVYCTGVAKDIRKSEKYLLLFSNAGKGKCRAFVV